MLHIEVLDKVLKSLGYSTGKTRLPNIPYRADLIATKSGLPLVWVEDGNVNKEKFKFLLNTKMVVFFLNTDYAQLQKLFSDELTELTAKENLDIEMPNLNEKDKKIVNFLKKHPEGVHISKISQETKLPYSTVYWRMKNVIPNIIEIKENYGGLVIFYKLKDIFLVDHQKKNVQVDQK